MLSFHFRFSRKQRLVATIIISFSFFVAEMVVGFLTHSLALIADAFHYLNDLIGFIVALAALLVSEREHVPPVLSYGWQRASTLGAFFNGVFLLALGISILLQSIERFISLQHVDDPYLVLIVGSVGLGLNIITILFLHEHSHEHGHGHSHSHSHSHSQALDGGGHAHSHTHDGLEQQHASTTDDPERVLPIIIDHGESGNLPDSLSMTRHHHLHRHNSARNASSGRDLGMLGVLIHVIGDAINNIGVIMSAAIIWKTSTPGRFYADPAVSLFIAIMILATSWPLVKHSGYILLQGAPGSIKLDDVQHDLEKIDGIESVHELHVWRLDQTRSIASVHLVVSDKSVTDFMAKAKTIGECLHAYGIHSATLQPELRPRMLDNQPAASPPTAEVASVPATGTEGAGSVGSTVRRRALPARCQLICGSVCENMMCCTQLSQ